MTDFRIRQAPSPTGYLHLGTARQVLFTKLFAMVEGGTYYLRLEDTDRNRLNKEAAKDLLETLRRLYLLPDEGITVEAGLGDQRDDFYGIYQVGDYGPYIQSERLRLYHKHAQNLIDKKLAYWSYLSEGDVTELQEIKKINKRPINYYKVNLEKFGEDELFRSVSEGLADKRKPSLRYRIQREEKIRCRDELVGESEFDLSLEEDFNILKSDGFPTYHLAHLVDDHLMATSLVFRAQEWYASLPRHQTMFQDYWGVAPKYLHIPFILGETGTKKLSKRDGNVNMKDYLDQGYLPEAILNYLAFLGWNPGTEQELYLGPEDFRTLDQAGRVIRLLENIAREFSVDKLSRAPARFSLEKLNWFNREYIKMLTLKEFAFLADKNRLERDVSGKNLRVGDYVYLVDTRQQKVFMTAWEESIGDGNFYPIGGGREGDDPVGSLVREVAEESVNQIRLDKSKLIPIGVANILRPFRYVDGGQWDGKRMHFYFYPLGVDEIAGQMLPDSDREWDYQWHSLAEVIRQNRYITFPIWQHFCERNDIPLFEIDDGVVRYYLAYLLDKNRVTVLGEVGSDSDCVLNYQEPAEEDLKWKKISLEESLANLEEILAFVGSLRSEMQPKQDRLYEVVRQEILSGHGGEWRVEDDSDLIQNSKFKIQNDFSFPPVKGGVTVGDRGLMAQTNSENAELVDTTPPSPFKIQNSKFKMENVAARTVRITDELETSNNVGQNTSERWRSEIASTDVKANAVEQEFQALTGEWESRIKEWLKDGNRDVGSYLWPLRVHLSGKTKSPSPFELLGVGKG